MSKINEIVPPELTGPFLFAALRVQHRQSQGDLSRRSGVSVATICSLEVRGKIGLNALERLAPHLGLTYEEALKVLALQHERIKRQRELREEEEAAIRNDSVVRG